MHWNDFGHMGWMWLWWILIIAAVVAVIWAAANATRRSDESGSTRESPVSALKRRYANGEIDRDTYQRMLEDLRK